MDHLSNGRLEVGIGTGLTIDPAYAMMGLPNWDNAERVARLREYVQIVDRLLSNEVTSFDGKYYQIEGAVMNPRPIQSPRPPLVIAALGPVMMKIAARHADKWNTMSFATDFEAQYAELRDRTRAMDEICASVERDPASLERSYLMFDPASRAGGVTLIGSLRIGRPEPLLEGEPRGPDLSDSSLGTAGSGRQGGLSGANPLPGRRR